MESTRHRQCHKPKSSNNNLPFLSPMNGDKEIYGSMNLLSSKLTARDTFDKIGYESDFVIFHLCILILIVQRDTINEKSFSSSVRVIQRPYFFQCSLRLYFTELL